MILKAYSSGGVGDALIVFAKLFNFWQKQSNNKKIEWFHTDRYAQYEKPVLEIMHSSLATAILTNNSHYYMANKDKRGHEWALSEAANNAGVYILTHVNDPILPLPINFPKIGTANQKSAKYICIHTSAGRMEDGSKRIVENRAIKQIKDFFKTKYEYILIGPEKIHEEGTTFVATPSILDAFGIIDNCDAFIGQDGVLSYYSMLINKPTLINFHIPELVNHYMNNAWIKKTTVLNGFNVLSQIPGPAILDFNKKILDT